MFIADVSGQPVDLAWPRGFSAWLLGGRVSLVAPDGSVVGRDGDVISGLNGSSQVCAIGATIYPPAR
ncbi:MAG TPA: hypothetical protein VFW86_06455 [Candidatus Limnocylindrales bacterium]|nr:hypothetical protein [Candidatus Limnocylindrales bacterium]